MHPLQISVVLLRLVQFVPLKGLSTFRLVSCAWNEAAIPRFLKHKSKLTISFEVTDSSHEIKDFNNVWKSKLSIPMPFSQFTFKWVKLVCPAILEFFELFGSSIILLNFSFISREGFNYDQLYNILFLLTPKLNNLALVASNHSVEFYLVRDEMRIHVFPTPEVVQTFTADKDGKTLVTLKESFYEECSPETWITNILAMLFQRFSQQTKTLLITWDRAEEGQTIDLEETFKSFMHRLLRDILLKLTSTRNLKLEEFEVILRHANAEAEWMSLTGMEQELIEFLVSQKMSLKTFAMAATVELSFFSQFEQHNFSELESLEIVNYDEDRLRDVFRMMTEHVLKVTT